MTFFQAGGFPMYFVLVLGLAAVGASARFSAAPDRARLARARALGIAALLASIAGMGFDLFVVSVHVSTRFADDPDLALILTRGVGESITPVVLGFTLVSAAAVVASGGMRRLT